jgi:hypothetical protein
MRGWSASRGKADYFVRVCCIGEGEVRQADTRAASEPDRGLCMEADAATLLRSRSAGGSTAGSARALLLQTR